MPKRAAAAKPPEVWDYDPEQWPPDYVAVYAWRQRQLELFRKDAGKLYGALEFYKTHCLEFIEDWVDSYDPRNAFSDERPTNFPFILFPRQRELVAFILECLGDQAPGLVEKSRDMGATWLAVGVSVWLWLFKPGAAVGWGSRKEQLVDKLGDPSSIFEKIRMILRNLPPEFLPDGLNWDVHITYMKCVNPENGATITGEAGDNIGRGGRTLVYFEDESAHYEHPELIEAALGDNTRVQIEISSVNGLGNVFERRASSAVEWRAGMVKPASNRTVRKFVLDWREHPDKTLEWYRARKEKAEATGMQHILAQEVDRDYGASVEGRIIDLEWIEAAVDAIDVLNEKYGANLKHGGPRGAGLDVADGGGDTNAIAIREGVEVAESEDWGARDTAVTARKAVDIVAPLGPMEVQYDSIGVGSGVKAEVNNLKEQRDAAGKPLMPEGLKFQPWAASAGVQNPEGRVNPGDAESKTNEDMFGNLKAQAWWELSRRFYRTWRWVVHGVPCDPDDIISLKGTLKNLSRVKKELAQAVFIKGAKLKLIVDKTADGQKSPNLADAIVMVFWPVLMEGQGLIDYYRGLALAAAGAKPGTGAPTATNGGVKLYVPVGMSTVFASDGTRLTIGDDRSVMVTAEDAPGLRAAGFKDNP